MTIDLRHEPVYTTNGVYRPYFLDDTGKLQGYQGFLCRLCHVYYADPTADPVERTVVVEDPPDRSYPGSSKYHRVSTPFPTLSERSCAAKILELLREKVL